MKQLPALWVLTVALHAGAVAAQPNAGDESVGLLPQTAPGTPWSFIGFAIATPSDPAWMVSVGTPRSGTMGRAASAAPTVAHRWSSPASCSIGRSTATPRCWPLRGIGTPDLSERWTLDKHEETLVRHAGARCARHQMTAREPEDRSPRKKPDKGAAPRQYLHVVGLSCVHPTEPRLLVELGVSERTARNAMNETVLQQGESVISSLGFQRYSEQALQTSAEVARGGRVQEAEALLKPYIDADAAWARYFLAQIVQRAVPTPPDAGTRIKTLLEPAAERGLADAQWMLGTLYLRGDGVPKDTAAGTGAAASSGRAGQRRRGVSARTDAAFRRRRLSPGPARRRALGHPCGSTRTEGSPGSAQQRARGCRRPAHQARRPVALAKLPPPIRQNDRLFRAPDSASHPRTQAPRRRGTMSTMDNPEIDDPRPDSGRRLHRPAIGRADRLAQTAVAPLAGTVTVGSSGSRIEGSGRQIDDVRSVGTFSAVRASGPIDIVLQGLGTRAGDRALRRQPRRADRNPGGAGFSANARHPHQSSGGIPQLEAAARHCRVPDARARFRCAGRATCARTDVKGPIAGDRHGRQWRRAYRPPRCRHARRLDQRQRRFHGGRARDRAGLQHQRLGRRHGRRVDRSDRQGPRSPAAATSASMRSRCSMLRSPALGTSCTAVLR